MLIASVYIIISTFRLCHVLNARANTKMEASNAVHDRKLKEVQVLYFYIFLWICLIDTV